MAFACEKFIPKFRKRYDMKNAECEARLFKRPASPSKPQACGCSSCPKAQRSQGFRDPPEQV